MFATIFIYEFTHGLTSDKSIEGYIILLVFYIFIGGFLSAFITTIFKIFKESKDIIQSSNKKMDRVKYLAENGMLIKNLKYTIKPVKKNETGPMATYKIQVIYEIEKGKTMCFESEPKYLTALGRDDGTVDLLIDPNDYTNYFIDFEIY